MGVLEIRTYFVQLNLKICFPNSDAEVKENKIMEKGATVIKNKIQRSILRICKPHKKKRSKVLEAEATSTKME